ncbi:Coenzyme F420 hydrogenase/dehydrogenase, beta subunit C-terminal domain [Pelagicoccus albus]|uniref:Coenzyme F420 hydrogenase/dehydrogenase, beta subunit C-terminal domain n=1 Tax=Pelagicoccus albus TaxID=415222 RepID=A0A7X1BAG3_9BACT|nr:Coenzyme F420 hydrogenase/dehydrogenase, beta subunit C-terminal domain [Pelagicoccus albus]MBC2607408.1 Coenzyme F420 hydrogenase/dehydrogenase, beta subunit C-terminal domain [Pelagicoccus albus]
MENIDNVDTSTPIGSYRKAWVGYSLDEEIRKRAASGGIVTATLCHLLETGRIQGALVCSSGFEEGEFNFRLSIAQTREDLFEAQSSKYFDIPVLRGLNLLKEFEGKVAVVGLPSQINSLSRRMSKNEELRSKVGFRIALFCGHNSKKELIERVWEKKGINPKDIDRFRYRQGHWRGQMELTMKDGQIQRFPFQDFSHYQNLHILSLDRCLNCHDHMGYYSDLSTGDVWLHEMREDPVKHSVFLARSPLAEEIVEEMRARDLLKAEPVDRRFVYRSQKRSINYHYNLSARAKVGKRLGVKIKDRTGEKPKIRDLIAAYIVLTNHKISKNPRLLRWFMKIPKPIVAAYLYLFKGLVNYERKDY